MAQFLPLPLFCVLIALAPPFNDEPILPCASIIFLVLYSFIFHPLFLFTTHRSALLQPIKTVYRRSASLALPASYIVLPHYPTQPSSCAFSLVRDRGLFHLLYEYRIPMWCTVLAYCISPRMIEYLLSTDSPFLHSFSLAAQDIAYNMLWFRHCLTWAWKMKDVPISSSSVHSKRLGLRPTNTSLLGHSIYFHDLYQRSLESDTRLIVFWYLSPHHRDPHLGSSHLRRYKYGMDLLRGPIQPLVHLLRIAIGPFSELSCMAVTRSRTNHPVDILPQKSPPAS